eukprot:2904486-Pleurochrysis_carterae.AAC.1
MLLRRQTRDKSFCHGCWRRAGMGVVEFHRAAVKFGESCERRCEIAGRGFNRRFKQSPRKERQLERMLRAERGVRGEGARQAACDGADGPLTRRQRRLERRLQVHLAPRRKGLRARLHK